ncbi:MAG: MCE family protein [Saprospiraceae bacterium]|nr:MCE family protein [Saprospiraceae bacterium]
MRKEQTEVTKLGVFVTIAVVLFTVAVYYIGNQQNLFGANFRVNTVFSHVKGLQPGNNVRYSGIDVGIVDHIEIVNDTTIRVEMLLERRVRSFMKSNAVAKIGSDGLVGNMIINVNPGEGLGEPITEGGTIPSTANMETDEVMNSLEITTENIALLTQKLLEVTTAIQAGEGPIAKLLEDPSWSSYLSRTLGRLNETTTNMEAITRQLHRDLDPSRSEGSPLSFLLRDTTFGKEMDQLSTEIDSLILQRTQPILTNMEEASADIATTSAALRKLTEDLNLEEGLAGTVLKDSIAAEDLRQILSNLNEGTYRFNENMEAMKHNFLFRRYFKKQEKKAKKAQRQEPRVATFNPEPSE